jgi:hypothetical protein
MDVVPRHPRRRLAHPHPVVFFLLSMRRKFLLWVWITLGLTTARCLAAPVGLPKERAAFLQSTNVWDFHLHLSPADWKAMEPANASAPGGPAGGPGFPFPGGPGGQGRPQLLPPGGFEFPWVTGRVEVNGIAFTNVGVRFKGNSSYNGSRNFRKRPFKLDFDRHVEGRTLAGLEEVFLNNNVNDPAQIRETLAYATFARAGIPAPKTTYARVWLTLEGESQREYVGLYTVIEPIEGDFLKQHFGTKKGLLVKPEGVRGLEYFGLSWEAHTNRYEVRSKVRTNDTQRFLSILRDLDQASDTDFPKAVTAAFDVDSVLRFVAVNAWLANYDSMLGTGHNYYLFLGGEDGRLRFIPWDLNEAFGRHPGAGPSSSQVAFSILQPHTTPNRFLDRLLGHAAFAARYREIVASLQSGACATNQLLGETRRLESLLATTLTEEPRNGPRPGGFGGPDGPQRPDGPRGPRPPQDSRDPNRERGPGPGFGPGPGGPGPGGPGRAFDNTPVSDWIRTRHEMVQAELKGARTAPSPQLRRMGPMGRPPGGPDRPRP